jgi:hypothetical protein
MSQPTPLRIIVQYRDRPFLNVNPIITAFFKWRDIEPLDDYATHISCNYDASKLYLVFDIHCKTCPDVNPEEVDLEVFKLSGIDS